MKSLLDEDLHPAAARIARGLGLDVESVHEIGRRGLSDREQLRYAATESRVLVTRNRDDFLRLTVTCFQTGEPHAGLLIVPRSLPNRLPARIAHGLKRWHDRQVESGDPGAYFVDFLPG